MVELFKLMSPIGKRSSVAEATPPCLQRAISTHNSEIKLHLQVLDKVLKNADLLLMGSRRNEIANEGH